MKAQPLPSLSHVTSADNAEEIAQDDHSESTDGTKDDPRVVMLAVIEVNRVPKLQPQPDSTPARWTLSMAVFGSVGSSELFMTTLP